jgi:proline iminopeptidase
MGENQPRHYLAVVPSAARAKRDRTRCRLRSLHLTGLLCLTAACAVTGRTTPPPAVSAGVHHVELNGVRHWFRVAGEPLATPEPVVFLHGGPGQGSVHFAELVGPWLEPSLRMVYVDQRASGRSDPSPDGEYTLPILVADLEALRLTLGAPKLALIGQSFGGTLALEYAAAYPDHVSAIVFVAGLFDTPLQCQLRNRTLAERAPAAYERVRARAEGDGRNDCLEFQAFESGEAQTAYSNAIMFPDSAVRLRMEDVEQQHGYRNTGTLGRGLFRSGLGSYRFTAAARVRAPVLVMAGAHDGTARSEGLRALAEQLPNSEFVKYERSGHFLYLDEPERFARDVAGFLARHD